MCDYNALLHSITGLLRMSGYAVFQAYDGDAARQLCHYLPDIGLLILNTEGTGMDLGTLVREVRLDRLDLPVLHIGPTPPPGLPRDVACLGEHFTPDELLARVEALVYPSAGERDPQHDSSM